MPTKPIYQSYVLQFMQKMAEADDQYHYAYINIMITCSEKSTLEILSS
jgi:hypothetical protein